MFMIMKKKSLLKARFEDKEEGEKWLKHIEKQLQDLQQKEKEKKVEGTPRQTAGVFKSPSSPSNSEKTPSSPSNTSSEKTLSPVVSPEKRSSLQSASTKREGWLGKAGRINRAFKDRYIVLTDNHLAYYDVKDKK